MFHGLEGVVALRFTIDKNGIPCDAAIVYAAPGSLFVRSALRALAASTFKPRTFGGQPIASRGSFTYRYFLPKESENGKARLKPIKIPGSRPAYPALAYLNHVEGFVTLRFSVDSKGRAHHPVIVHSEPPGVFDDVAKWALIDSHFKIRTDHGKPVAYHATYTYQFRLEEPK